MVTRRATEKVKHFHVVIRRRCGDAWIAWSGPSREAALALAEHYRQLEDAASVDVECDHVEERR